MRAWSLETLRAVARGDALAGQLGMDYLLTDNLLVNASVWYVDIDTKASVNGPTALGYSKTKVNVDVDPWVYMVGLGYKF